VSAFRSQLGSCLGRATTWNPLRASADDVFRYIDLSSVDQDTKTVVEAREVTCGEAPSRARQLVSAGDVLVSTVRPNLNGVARVPSGLDGATASTGFCVLRPELSKIDGGYLFQWVKSSAFVSNMVSKATGASYPAVSDRIIFESLIPLPPLEEQQRLAAILDQAEILRTQRRAALAQLDSLARSVFLDMFGAALESPIRISLGKLVGEFRYGTSEKSGSAGFPALRIPNVASGSLNLNELKTVNVEAAEFKRLKLQSGDLLFVRTNGNPDYVGRCAVFEPALVADTGFEPSKFIYASYLIRARLRGRDLLPLVLQQYLSDGEGRRALRSRCKTSAGQYNINTEGLGAIPIPVFPVDLQQTFIARIQAIEALKTTHRAAQSELDALFASLQQRAFSGLL